MTAIHDRISFHNVDHLEKKGELPGLLLQRFPDPIRLALGQGDHEEAASLPKFPPDVKYGLSPTPTSTASPFPPIWRIPMS